MEKHAIKIKNVNDYIKNNNSITGTKHRQYVHFDAPMGWLNDPNGFIYYKGYYHLFYQFNPYAPEWGAMHWGHARSKNLVDWEHLEIALAPSEFYDNDSEGGCFSGTSIVEKGILYLFYTGTVIKNGKMVPTQNIAYSHDGINFKKYLNNPIIENDYHSASSEHFRDPKVWKENNKYYMLVGTSINNKGNALLYESNDLYNWKIIGPIIKDTIKENLGTMWECPDFFKLEDKHILTFSPMGLGRKTTLYLIGKMDYKMGEFMVETIKQLNHGFDFYAPQTLINKEGNRIMIAWQNGWEWMPWWKNFGPTAEDNWCGSMSFPQVVTLSQNKDALCFDFISTLNNYFEKNIKEQEVILEPNKPYIKELKSCDFLLDLNYENIKNNNILSLKIENNIGDFVVIKIKHEVIEIESNDNREKCRMPSNDVSGLKILSDTSSIEIISDNREYALSINAFLKKGMRKLSIKSDKNHVLRQVNIKTR